MDIETEIKNIKERNQSVEKDKAWERSWTRRTFIFVITYATAGVWLFVINDTFPWLKALVPAIGYILSTLTMPTLKNWWIKNNK